MPYPLQSPAAQSQQLGHFTNRETERNVLRNLLQLSPGQSLPVVMFYGVGGTGKSWLLRKLREELPPAVPSAILDFETRSGGTTDTSWSLAKIRDQFRTVECPLFDLAYVWLRHKEGVKDEPFLRANGPAGAAVEALGELASGAADGVSLVGMFVKKMIKKLKKQAVGTKVECWIIEWSGDEDWLRLRQMAAQEIYPLLSRRLLTDLANGLPERAGHACRGVLFLDTCEALRLGTPADAQGHEREEWVRELVAPDSPLLLVLAGRDRLRWADRDPDFADLRLLEQHLVGGLSETDARQFLTNCGVIEGLLQAAVLRACTDPESPSGYHPFSLGLSADAIVTEQGRGKSVDPDTFDIRPGDSATLAQRFLKSLANPAHELWVKRLSLTPRFDETAGRAAHSDGHGVEQEAAWRSLLRYSFLRGTDESGFYTLHTRMRDALAVTLTAQDKEHFFWEQHWRKRSVADCDDWAGLAWYHRYQQNPSAASEEWNELAKVKRTTRKMADHYQLLGWWNPVGLFEVAKLSLTQAETIHGLVSELLEASLGRKADNYLQAIAGCQLRLRGSSLKKRCPMRGR